MALSPLYDRVCELLENYLADQPGNADDADDSGKLGMLIEHAGATLVRAFKESEQPQFWLYWRIPTADAGANKLILRCLLPLLSELEATNTIQGWWWLNKGDCVGPALRLRILVSRTSRRQIGRTFLQNLKNAGCDATAIRYEPEVCLFGGSEGIRIAHSHFCADSRFLAAWMAGNGREESPIIPAGLSLALILTMLRACGLDIFEIWDVFSRVYDKRRFVSGLDSGNEKYRNLARRVLVAGNQSVFELYMNHNAELLLDYATQLQQLGTHLMQTCFHGRLECGIREFLAPLILFHWNRVGFSAHHQYAFSQALVKELEYLSRKPAIPEKKD